VTHRSGKTGALDAQPYIHRRFSDRETDEIRLYLRGAADELLARGSGTANITLRAIGGGGPDTLIDSTTSGRNVRFYDPRGENTFVTGPSTSVSTRRYERPRPSGVGPHEFYLDWGAAAFPAIVVGANADHGVVLGGGVVRYSYGFRRTPFKHRFAIRGGLSTTGRATFDYESYFAEVTPKLDVALRASVTGVAPTRFYGFGNDTPKQTPEFHRVDQYRVVVDPSLIFFSQSRLSFSFGPVFKFTDTQAVPGRLVQDSVYGAGQFSQFGAGAALDWRPVGRAHLRSRDVFGQTTWTSGFQFSVHASTFPAILDVANVFGTVAGDVRAHVTAPIPTFPTLSLRVSGSKVWGEDEVPYHEAAYIGGGGSLRGFSAYRFAGDAALSGSAELRLAFGEFYFLVPVQFGVLGVIDVGRVYVDGASPGGWHSAAGGGIWFGPLRGAQTINVSVAGGEQVTVHVYMGFGV